MVFNVLLSYVLIVIKNRWNYWSKVQELIGRLAKIV